MSRPRPPAFGALVKMQCPAIKELLPQFADDPHFLVDAKRRARRSKTQAATELEVEVDRLLTQLGNPLPQVENGTKPIPQRSWRWIGVSIAALGAVAAGVGHGIGQDVWHKLRPAIENVMARPAQQQTIGPLQADELKK